MKNHHLLVTIGTLLFFYFCPLQPIEAQVTLSPKEFEATIDSIFSDKSEMTSPGASVIILKGSKTVLSKSYGSSNLSFGVPFNENTVFPLPNFTDQLVVFSLLQLEKKKLIKLADPVNKHLPEFGFQDHILISHLLNHSSDLPLFVSLRLMAGWKFTDPFHHDDFLNLTKKFTTDLKPDTKIKHSHTGVKILQMLVEKVTGQRFSDYAATNIFQPLGMTSSLVKNERFKEANNNSIGYEETDAGFQRTYPTELALLCPMAYSTQNDFEKWMLNVQTRKIEGSIIEKMDHALAMKGSSQKRLNGTYCIGQQQYYKFSGEDEFYFMDADEGHSWSWRRLPRSDVSVMAIGNLNSSISNKVNAIIRLLVPPTTNSLAGEDPTSTPIRLSGKEMKALTGLYWNEEYLFTTEISVQDGELYHSDKDNGFNFPLVVRTKTSFVTPYGGVVEITNTEGTEKRLKNITTSGSVFSSKQYAVVALKEGDQLEYEGFYNSDKLSTTYSIVWEDQKLILRRSRKPDLVLTPIGGNRFRTPEIDFRLIEFEKNGKGGVQKMNVSNTLVKNIGFRKL